ncbi:MAG: hypothetical protein ACI4JM_08035 [Oscillospiraceae bacterium]
MKDNITTFSLLFPEEYNEYFILNSNTENDLSINFLAEHLSENSSEKSRLKAILCRMPVRREIIEYRQAIYNDLKNFPEILNKLYEIFSVMQFYNIDNGNSIYDKSSIWELIGYLRSLQNYVNSVSQMQEIFKEISFSSDGMRKLAEYVDTIYTESGFSELAKDIEFLGDDVDGIQSMTLGVNFDSEFYPAEVGIISMNKYQFGEKGLLERFFQFHKKKNPDDSDIELFTMMTHQKRISDEENPLMNNLTRIIEQMLPNVTRKLYKVLKRYTHLSGTALAKCGDELLFYIRFIELENKLMSKGLPCCIPDFSDGDTFISDLYNIKLAMCYLEGTVKNDIVCNDLKFTKSENILIMTGPNQGGKTILTQGTGLAFLMFQHGVFVPCSNGKIRICDGIYTHFPADENQTVTLGRLGEEADRFSKICETATSESLLLLNESFATTSHTESLYIAEDVVKYLCCLGARTCFNTHMHELAENTDKFADEKAVCGAASVVMGKRDGENTFRISYEKPNGKSFAHDIAYQYGITFEQLMEKMM